jgi:hypothetical protein
MLNAITSTPAARSAIGTKSQGARHHWLSVLLKDERNNQGACQMESDSSDGRASFWDNAEYMEHWPSQISLVVAAVRGSKGRRINMKEPYRD